MMARAITTTGLISIIDTLGIISTDIGQSSNRRFNRGAFPEGDQNNATNPQTGLAVIAMTAYSPETVKLLRCVLDDAWASMRPHEKARSSKTLVAVRILEAAASGERNPGRLLAQALVPWRIEDMSVPIVSIARDAPSPMESRSMR
jgi:hypothetical protein